MPIHGICVLALLPRFPESFSVLCRCSPLGVLGEPPSPCSCRGREAQKLPVCAFRRQLMAQPCFGNLCSATGAGRGMNTLLLFPWALLGIWEFLSAAVGSDRKRSSTNTLGRICSLFLPGVARWDFLCLPHRLVC